MYWLFAQKKMMDGFKCIAKEAELISEWLRHGRRMLTDDEYTLCHEIRAVACKLFVFRGEWTVDIAAALLVCACLPSPNHILVCLSNVCVT